ncbi:helix-turn-helix domain-containing protein [Nevskia sp.]|uniref:helix-turn-helix domain-containing protein n=1 Tax=Nevskia sp. TaxID=1929292 RepID=UPI0025D14FAC|nr:helix-turn-helix domain-containing protein [Nevskia sp.]
MTDIGIPAVDAYSEACRTRPSLERSRGPRKGIGLYGWRMAPTKEVHIPETRELILSVHLGGARRVRVYTEQGLSRSFSKPGDITLIPRGQAVRYRTDGEVEFATVHFPVNASTLRSGALSAGMLNLPTCLFALRDDYVLASVKTLMHASKSSSPDNGRYVAKLFEALTWHLARVIDDSDAERIQLGTSVPSELDGPDFNAVLSHIENQLAEKLTLQGMADYAGVCRTVFAQEFAERFGCSPHRFITQRRIEKAKSLLAQGRLSITDIAYEVGFSGQSHFSSTFKALTGHAPTSYVESAQLTS